MHRNRSLAMKLRNQQRRRTMIETPRTDNFINLLPTIHLPSSLPNEDVLRVCEDIRSLMLHWSEFARGLERELMMSTPKEWRE